MFSTAASLEKTQDEEEMECEEEYEIQVPLCRLFIHLHQKDNSLNDDVQLFIALIRIGGVVRFPNPLGIQVSFGI